MLLKFSIGKIVSPISCLLLICSLFLSIKAESVTKQATIEIEKEAMLLGKNWNGEHIRRSIALFNKTAENWEKLRYLEKAAHCLKESAKLSLLVSDVETAILNLQKAIRFDSKIKNIDGQVISHSLLFQIYNLKNQENKSQFHIKKALKLSESANNYSKAYANYVVGEKYINIAHILEADKYLTKSLNFVEKTGNTKLKAKVLQNIGMLLGMRGKKDEAIQKITEAISLWKDLNNKRELALVNNALGFVYVISNEKQKGLEHYHLANNVIPDEVDFQEKAKLNAGISSLYIQYGNFLLAEKYLKLAIEFFEKSNNKSGKLFNLIELGKLYYLADKKVKSKLTFERAKTLLKEVKNPIYFAIYNEYTGLIDFGENNIDEAIQKLNTAIKFYKKIGHQLPRIHNILGRTYEKKGNFSQAINSYKLAEKTSSQTNEPFVLAESLYNLGRLHQKNGKIKLALKTSKESISITEKLYEVVNNDGLSEKYLSNSYDRYELYIDLLMKMHELQPNNEFDIKALLVSEKARSRLMRENLHFAEADLTIDANPNTIEKEDDLISRLSLKKEELTNLLESRDKKKKEIDKLKTEIASINDKLEQIKAELRQKSPIYSAIKNSDDFNLKGFQSDILDENTVLLEFFFGKENSYVWLISKTDLEVFKLPTSKILDPKIDSLYKLLTFPNDVEVTFPKDVEANVEIQTHQKKLSEVKAKYSKLSKDLSEILFGKIAEKIKDKRLIIVPDGKLRYFPIEALPFPNQETNTYFLKTNEIVYEPSASMLHLLKSKRDKNISASKDFLVYSDAVFSLDDERLDKAKSTYVSKENSSLFDHEKSLVSLDYLKRLESSENESKIIFNYFNSSSSKTISGFNANRNNFLDNADTISDYKVLHFATHGYLNEEIPELSGIVLSRFNEQRKKQNGMIWLQDIYKLKLKADLVVLSACDTGIGKEIKGEGLMSLTNGFLQVGAKSVVSSHWKVDDDATLKLMKNFYEILAKENVSSSKALQKAKIRLSENPNFKFPFYWASFTIHGDFENKPKIKTRLNYSNYFYLLILAVCLPSIVLLIKHRHRLLKKHKQTTIS